MSGKKILLLLLVTLAALTLIGWALFQRYQSVETTPAASAIDDHSATPTNSSPTPHAAKEARAQVPLTIVFGVYRPPYMFEKKNLGIDFDLATAALESAGYKIIPLHSPNNRAFREIEMGKVDGVIGLSPLQDRPGIYFSKPMIVYDNVIITKREKKLTIRRLEDLRKVRFLAFSNAKDYLGSGYSKLVTTLKYDTDIANQEMQNRMFWQNKVDAIILDLNVFRYYRRALEKELKTSDEVDVHRIFSQQQNERAAAFRDPQVRDSFDRALRELKASGKYQKIIDKYLYIEPITPQ